MIRILGKWNKQHDYVFVDYSEENHPLGTQFRFNEKVVTLAYVGDSFLNSLDEIPEGFKTICHFDGLDTTDLKELKGWEPTKKTIVLEKV